MRAAKKAGSRLEKCPGSLDKENTVMGLHQTFQIGMLGPTAFQPDKTGKKHYLNIHIKNKKTGQEK